MTVKIVVLGEKKHQPYCMALPTREIPTAPPEIIEQVFAESYGKKMQEADLVIAWLPESKAFNDIPEHLLKSIEMARNLKKRIILVRANNIEEDIAFWHRPFPQLYRCKKCGKYALMKQAEPWAGHLACAGKVPDGEVQPDLNRFGLGEWEPIAYGSMAWFIWADLKKELKT